MESKEAALRALESEVTVLARRLRRTYAELARAIHPRVQPTGYALLSTLHRGGARRQSDLCGELGLDKGAVSRQVNALEGLGLVQRTPDPVDRRAYQVDLSDDARTRLVDVQTRARSRYAERLGGWSEAEIAQVADDLSRYNALLEG